MIHVIATDLDHTLLRENHALSKETAKVLSQFARSGIEGYLGFWTTGSRPNRSECSVGSNAARRLFNLFKWCIGSE